jgi:protein O-GlcNAc transferase
VQRLLAVDLFLDSDEYNAHSSGVDALWAGVPLITMQGEKLASRVASSLLRAVGLSELITTNRSAFESLALSLVNNRNGLDSLRRKLISKRKYGKK